jgi:histone H3/H4
VADSEDPSTSPSRGGIGSYFADEERIILMDYLLLVLGLASAALLFVQWNVTLTGEEQRILGYVDKTAQVLFGLGFVGKVLTSPNKTGTLRTRWPELVGVMPLTQPFLVTPRYYPIVQIAVVITRLSIGLDRHLGERALSRIFARYRAALVEELTDPILLQATHITQNILKNGQYARSIGNSLEEQRPQIHGAVEKAVRANPRMGRMMRIPGSDRLVRETVDATLDSAIEALTSEEMDEVVEETLDEVFEDFRAEVGKRKWKEQGVGISQVAGAFRPGAKHPEDAEGSEPGSSSGSGP